MKTRKLIALILLAIFVSSCAPQKCWNTENNKNTRGWNPSVNYKG